MRKLGIKARIALRYAKARLTGSPFIEKTGNPATSRERVLFVASSWLPTLQLSFIRPLGKLAEEGIYATELLSEQQIREMFGATPHSGKVARWIEQRISTFNPTIIVFCRFSGQFAAHIMQSARTRHIPTIFHIDDDLLSVPPQIGRDKFAYHNQPARIDTVRMLLQTVDLVYCSTAPLLQRLHRHGLEMRCAMAGNIYCSGSVQAKPSAARTLKIGYMGFDHAHDFEIALPAIAEAMKRYPDISFELFGSIPVPPVLLQFKNRVRIIPPVPGYEAFMKKFASLGWDIGICPLADTEFNAVKANTKWVEYTAVGTAVIATRGTIYDQCCADSCGILAADDEWLDALCRLIEQPDMRFTLVTNAQQKLQAQYSIDALRSQVLDVFEKARNECRSNI